VINSKYIFAYNYLIGNWVDLHELVCANLCNIFIAIAILT